METNQLVDEKTFLKTHAKDSFTPSRGTNFAVVQTSRPVDVETFLKTRAKDSFALSQDPKPSIMEINKFMDVETFLKTHAKDPFTPSQHRLLNKMRLVRWVGDRVLDEAFDKVGLEILALPTKENALLFIKTFFVPLFGDVLLTLSIDQLIYLAGLLKFEFSLVLLAEKLATENAHQIAYRKISKNCCKFNGFNGLDFCIELMKECKEPVNSAISSLNALIEMANKSVTEIVKKLPDAWPVAAILHFITGIILQQFLEYGIVIPQLAVTMQILGSKFSKKVYDALVDQSIDWEFLETCLVARTIDFNDHDSLPMHVDGFHGIIPDILRDEMFHLEINAECFNEAFTFAIENNLEEPVVAHVALLIEHMPIMTLASLLVDTMSEFDFGNDVDIFVGSGFLQLIKGGPYENHPRLAELAIKAAPLPEKKIALASLIEKYAKVVCASSAHEAMAPIYTRS